jgi:uncharacterized membrane protein YeiH
MTFSFSLVLVWLDLAGVFFFAVSGSLLAARKQFDIIGSLLLASVVGLGGGVIRDIIINNGPPAAFTNPAYLAPPVLAAVLVYFLFSSVQRFTSLLTLFDAGGLALFCITGTLKALAAGMHPVAAVLLGVTTAVGGGLLRDITANEVPQLFDPQGRLCPPGLRGGGPDGCPVDLGPFHHGDRDCRGRRRICLPRHRLASLLARSAGRLRLAPPRPGHVRVQGQGLARIRP